METLDYGAVARKHAEQVQAGEVLACRWVKAAAQRQLNDLARFTGEKIWLEPWQVFILATTFGWVKPDGRRRFRRSYIEVPRICGSTSAHDALGISRRMVSYYRTAQKAIPRPIWLACLGWEATRPKAKTLPRALPTAREYALAHP